MLDCWFGSEVVVAPELKEIRLSLKIGEHDLVVKSKRAQGFLDKGDKVRLALQLKGREMMFRDRVRVLMEKVRVSSGANFEKPIDKLGTRFFATLVKSKNENKDSQIS